MNLLRHTFGGANLVFYYQPHLALYRSVKSDMLFSLSEPLINASTTNDLTTS